MNRIKLISIAGLAFAASTFFIGSATAQVIVVNNDGAGEGFNDATPVAPVAGNPGTTLGQQRLNAFQAAADAWNAVLNNTVPIRVGAQLDPLTCSPTQGVLGAAGPTTAFRDFTGAPVANTWYPAALANHLAGTDLDPGGDDIGATFNSDVDDDPNCLTGLTWSYTVGGAVPAGTISFFDTVLHEIGHGLGFLTFVDITNGQRLLSFDDIYMTFLEDHSAGMSWSAMTDAQRAASVTDSGDLHWTGGLANGCGSNILTGGLAAGHATMYAPSPVELGSSVSHWDVGLAPDELMEPFATATSDQRMTNRLLAEIGWDVNLQPCPPPHNPIISGHHPVLSPHHPVLSGHHPIISGHNPILSGHNPRLSGHHPIISGHNPRLSGHNPILSGHDPRISLGGHNVIQSRGHDPVSSRSGGHSAILSQGHDPLVSSGGHSPILSSGGGHDPVMSGGGHDPMMSGFRGGRSFRHPGRMQPRGDYPSGALGHEPAVSAAYYSSPHSGRYPGMPGGR